MVIDYSKWDNLKVSSSDEEEDSNEEDDPIPPTNSTVTAALGATMIPQPTATLSGSGSLQSLSEEQIERIPKIVLLVNSTQRDLVLRQMLQNELEYARPFGQYGISLPCTFFASGSSFCSFFAGFSSEKRVAQIQASLLHMTTAEYQSLVGSRPSFQGLMAGIPYDAQFRGDACADGESALHVRYGQAGRQALYQCMAGPEFKVCKMGPTQGGPVVLVQAKMRVNGFGGEGFLLEKIDVEEEDVPRVVSELLNKAKEEYEY